MPEYVDFIWLEEITITYFIKQVGQVIPAVLVLAILELLLSGISTALIPIVGELVDSSHCFPD